MKNLNSQFQKISYSFGKNDIEELFSLSPCQLEQTINKEDRAKLIEYLLANVENWAGMSRYSYQYLLANIIQSTPEDDVSYIIDNLNGKGAEIEQAYPELSDPAKEVFIRALSEIANKYWNTVHYLGEINNFLLGVKSIVKDVNGKLLIGTRGIYVLDYGKYNFGHELLIINESPDEENNSEENLKFEVSAFDPIECHFIDDNYSEEGTQILPAIIVKIFAVNESVREMNALLEIPKAVILPEVTSQLFSGLTRVGKGSCNLLKNLIKNVPGSLTKFLDKLGPLGYKLKVVGTEIALYTNLNVEIARFTGTGKLMTKVYPYNKAGVRVLSWEDEIEYITTGNTTKTGKLELAKADDGVIFFRELVSSRYIAKTGEELKTFLDNLSDLPAGKSYKGNVYRSVSVASEVDYGAIPTQMTDHNIYSSWGRYDLQGQENAMYLSKTLSGNKTELVPHYGEWSSFSTYKFTDVQADNLLDLTDDIIRQQLGTQFDDLTRVFEDKADMYEFTNILASWARQKGYNGLIVPGARGAKNYENIIIFKQSYVDEILQGKTETKVTK